MSSLLFHHRWKDPKLSYFVRIWIQGIKGYNQWYFARRINGSINSLAPFSFNIKVISSNKINIEQLHNQMCYNNGCPTFCLFKTILFNFLRAYNNCFQTAHIYAPLSNNGNGGVLRIKNWEQVKMFEKPILMLECLEKCL